MVMYSPIHNLDDPLDVMGWAESAFMARLICGRCHTGPGQPAVRTRAGHKPSQRFHNHGEEEKKAPTRTFSSMNAPTSTSALTFKTLLTQYAKRALTHGSLDSKSRPSLM